MVVVFVILAVSCPTAVDAFRLNFSKDHQPLSESLEQGMVMQSTAKIDFHMNGATGKYAACINGNYQITGKRRNKKAVYRKIGSPKAEFSLAKPGLWVLNVTQWTGACQKAAPSNGAPVVVLRSTRGLFAEKPAWQVRTSSTTFRNQASIWHNKILDSRFLRNAELTFHGAVGRFARYINGKFKATGKVRCGHMVLNRTNSPRAELMFSSGRRWLLKMFRANGSSSVIVRSGKIRKMRHGSADDENMSPDAVSHWSWQVRGTSGAFKPQLSLWATARRTPEYCSVYTKFECKHSLSNGIPNSGHTCDRHLPPHDGDGATGGWTSAPDLYTRSPWKGNYNRVKKSCSKATAIGYLPKKVNGVPVLTRTSKGKYRVDNSRLQSNFSRLSYRTKMEFAEKHERFPGPKWGSTVRGVDKGNGWVEVDLKAGQTCVAVLVKHVECQDS